MIENLSKPEAKKYMKDLIKLSKDSIAQTTNSFPSRKVEIDKIQKLSELIFNNRDGLQHGISILYLIILDPMLSKSNINNLHEITKEIRRKASKYNISHLEKLHQYFTDVTKMWTIITFLKEKQILILDSTKNRPGSNKTGSYILNQEHIISFFGFEIEQLDRQLHFWINIMAKAAIKLGKRPYDLALQKKMRLQFQDMILKPNSKIL